MTGTKGMNSISLGGNLCSDTDENKCDSIRYLQAKEITKLKGKFASMVANLQDIINNVILSN